MKIHIVNIAENSRTKRGKRHIYLFSELEKHNLSGHYYTSPFDHAKKSSHSTETFLKHEKLIWIPGYRSHFGILRQLSHLIFSISVCISLILKLKKHDIVVVSSIPPELGFLVAIACIVRPDTHFSIDVRDTWPDSFPGTGLKKTIFSKYCNALNFFTYRRAKHIFYVNEDFLPFIKKFTSDQDNVTYIPLGADLERWKDCSLTRDLRQGAIYVGNFNSQFDLRVFNGVELEKLFGPPLIVGDGELKDIYVELFKKSDFTGLISEEEVTEKIGSASIGILPITGGATLPNKLYDYILGGVDILTNSQSLAIYLTQGDTTKIKRINSVNGFIIRNQHCRRDFIVDYADSALQIVNILKIP